MITRSIDGDCAICGGVFLKNKHNQKYCSKKCKNTNRRNVELPKIHKLRGFSGYSEKNCKVCGKIFKPTTSRAKYCSKNCSAIILKKIKNKFQKEYHERKKSSPAYIISRMLRTCIRGAIKGNVPSKKMCDFTPSEFKRHIEGMFTEGMGWHNWGEFLSLRVLSQVQLEEVKDKKCNRLVSLFDKGAIDLKELRDCVNRGGLVDIKLAGDLDEEPIPDEAESE